MAIDVNSGRATRERSIEETASKTNLEAASEVARQLRLRDLAGLIVVDFIDMEESRNIRAVERRFKEALQSDRARIQMGRISGFGLLEMSRQRLRPSVQEISSVDCPHCAGSGRVRSIESAALQSLRAIEEEGVRGRAARVRASLPTAVALYLLNGKRAILGDIEARYGMAVTLDADDAPGPPECRVEVVEARAGEAAAVPAVPAAPAPPREEEAPKRRSRRRARAADKIEDAPEAAADEVASEAETASDPEDAEADGERARRRRRGRRGGRRQARARANGAAKAAPAEPVAEAGDDMPVPVDAAPDTAEAEAVDPSVAGAASIARPKRRRRVRKAKPKAEENAAAEAPAAEADEGDPAVEARAADGAEPVGSDAPAVETQPEAEEAPAARPRRRRARPSRDAGAPAADGSPDANGAGASDATPAPEAENPAPEAENPAPDTPPPAGRRGWWNRVTGAS